MKIRVKIKNDLLGDKIYWEGDSKDISGIGNILAMTIAIKVINDRKTRKKGIWTVSVLNDNETKMNKYMIVHHYKYGGKKIIYFENLDEVEKWIKHRIVVNMRINQNTISLYKKLGHNKWVASGVNVIEWNDELILELCTNKVQKMGEYEHIEIPFSLERPASLKGRPTNDEYWDSSTWND